MGWLMETSRSEKNPRLAMACGIALVRLRVLRLAHHYHDYAVQAKVENLGHSGDKTWLSSIHLYS
jgi:hypothetical protein